VSIGAPPASPPAIGVPGSLKSLMDGLVAVQATLPQAPAIADLPEFLALYRWKPNSGDLPALYNWLLPSTNEMRDTARVRDSIFISTRIVTAYADSEDQMAFVEAAADAYRALIDPTFWNGSAPPLGFKTYATWGIRTSMNSVSDQLGEVPCFGIEIVQNFWLDHRIR
jgi:hypothetical protein